MSLLMVLSLWNIESYAARPPKDPVELTITTSDGLTDFTLDEGTSVDVDVTITAESPRKVEWTQSDNLLLISRDRRTGASVYRYVAPGVDNDTTYGGWIEVRDADNPDGVLLDLTFNVKDVKVPDPSNTPPTAEDLTLEVDEDVTVKGTLTATDEETPVLKLYGAVTSPPDHGAADVTGLEVTYTPDADYNGSDSFVVTVSDGDGGTDTATVNVTVNPIDDMPVAIADNAETYVDTLILIDVLANDTDIDGGPMVVLSVNDVIGGSAVISEDGMAVEFTPNVSVGESAGFSYTLNGESTAYVTVVIIPVPDEPLKYVALGDSIPYGVYNRSFWDYLGGGTDSYSYVEQFADDLGPDVHFSDMSVSGYNTIDVLSQIGTISTLISDADVITLCVGANDIMDAAGRGFSGLQKYDIDWAVAETGRDNFELYWPQLVDAIEELNDDVTLIVMTIYNPYRITDSYFDLVDPYFTSSVDGDYGLNHIINKTMSLYSGKEEDNPLLAADFDYRVADIYSAFNGHDDKDSLTGFYNSFCDPHPNQLGHNLLYSEHMALFP